MINKEKIFENVKLKISISNLDEEENIEMKKNNKNIFKIATVACCLLILTTGITFAKDIEKIIKYYFGDERITEAAEQGYVEDVNMDNINTETTLSKDETEIVVEDINVSGKIDEFLMDDINLSTNFSFIFDEKIKEYIDLNNLQIIYFTDLIILDEENRIIATNCLKPDFDKKCIEYNLNYDFNEFSSNMPLVNTSIISIDKDTNLVKCNITCNSSDEFLPNSKELTFIFTEIRLEKFEEYTGQDISNGEYLKCDSVNLIGDWKLNVKVPEKMYNREKSEYIVVGDVHPDIKVSYVRCSESAFKFKAWLLNYKQPDLINRPLQKEFARIEELVNKGEMTWEEGNKLISEFYNKEENEIAERKWQKENEAITRDYMLFDENEERSIDKITHITDSNGNKYKTVNSSIAYVDIEQNLYEFTADFELTKYNATDKMTVTLIYYGEPVNIELERIK